MKSVSYFNITSNIIMPFYLWPIFFFKILDRLKNKLHRVAKKHTKDTLTQYFDNLILENIPASFS